MRPLLTYVVRCDLMSIPVVLTRYALFFFFIFKYMQLRKPSLEQRV